MIETYLKPLSVRVSAGPSLALTKYWGKAEGSINRPATPSLGMTLDTFQSTVHVSTGATSPCVTLNGETQPLARFAPFLEVVQKQTGLTNLHITSTNNYPTAAGLASSSSGFAALACAVAELSERPLNMAAISQLARIGSGSAARAVYGGFTEFPAGAEAAIPLYNETYWPELRVIVCQVTTGPKDVSSRAGMERVLATSPYYQAWINDARVLHGEALTALAAHDLEKLGDIARHSYLRMFSTMLAASPPLIYWQPESLALIHRAEQCRQQGLGVWETMDAGPQVKLLCQVDDVEAIVTALSSNHPTVTPIVVHVGAGPCRSTTSV